MIVDLLLLSLWLEKFSVLQKCNWPLPFSTLNVQSKDLEAAEDYYSRAVAADPSDGEIMSEYAKLVWELHHDREKASNLFEQAVQATPGERYNL